MRNRLNAGIETIKKMRRFHLWIGPFCIEHDYDYGIDLRTGWSYIHDGHVVEDINPSLIKTVWVAVCYHWDRLIHPEEWE